MTGPLVVGLGAPDRGDDAVGATVARSVAARLPGVTVVVHEDPTGLLDLWDGHSQVVVVDAVRTGAPPGTVHLLETAPANRGHGSTHVLGLAEVVELARALGRLPERLVVVGVEAEQFDHGAPLSPAVAAAVHVAAQRVCEELGHVPR